MRPDGLHTRHHGACRGLAGAAQGVTRRGLVTALVLLLVSMAGTVGAAGRKVRVGVLKLSSSAPIILGVEDGSFLEEALRALPR
jgi:hypothetical protein